MDIPILILTSTHEIELTDQATLLDDRAVDWTKARLRLIAANLEVGEAKLAFEEARQAYLEQQDRFVRLVHPQEPKVGSS
jgi:hypothetical protein